MPIVIKDDSVLLEDLHPDVAKAAFDLERVYRKRFGVDLVITSGNDGTHKKNSFHYKNAAIDIRVKNVPRTRWTELLVECRQAISDDLFDLILELKPGSEHIHLERDPKAV